jgi:hypothetical protein
VNVKRVNNHFQLPSILSDGMTIHVDYMLH